MDLPKAIDSRCTCAARRGQILVHASADITDRRQLHTDEQRQAREEQARGGHREDFEPQGPEWQKGSLDQRIVPSLEALGTAR
jgi:hypothetical protein